MAVIRVSFNLSLSSAQAPLFMRAAGRRLDCAVLRPDGNGGRRTSLSPYVAGSREGFGRQVLLAVELDYVLVVDLDWNLIPLGKSEKLSAELLVVLLEIGKIECRVAKEAVLEQLVLPALLLE